jgi:hypothetical protein
VRRLGCYGETLRHPMHIRAGHIVRLAGFCELPPMQRHGGCLRCITEGGQCLCMVTPR